MAELLGKTEAGMPSMPGSTNPAQHEKWLEGTQALLHPGNYQVLVLPTVNIIAFL